MDRLRDLLSDTWARAFVLPALIFFAERDLRAGRLHAARTRFLRAARRRPTSFRAHFGLARVYLASRDVGLARRELVVARTLSPARFRELRHQLPEPYRHEEHAATPGTPGTPRPVVDDAPQLVPAAFGDCSGPEEWRRFEDLGPIRPDEVAGVDWDGLLHDPRRRED